MTNEGWTCPVCRRGVAPGEKACDHGQPWAAYPRVFPDAPTTAIGPTPLNDCGCPALSVCGNAACPRACRVTC